MKQVATDTKFDIKFRTGKASGACQKCDGEREPTGTGQITAN